MVSNSISMKSKRQIGLCTMVLGAANAVMSVASAVVTQSHAMTLGFAVAAAICSFTAVVIGYWERLRERISDRDPEGTSHTDLELELDAARNVPPTLVQTSTTPDDDGPVTFISAGDGSQGVLRNRYTPAEREMILHLSTLQHESPPKPTWDVSKDSTANYSLKELFEDKRKEPATIPAMAYIKIVSQYLPRGIQIQTSSPDAFLTVGDVLTGLYHALQIPGMDEEPQGCGEQGDEDNSTAS